MEKTRNSEYPILPLILNRYSPRALSGEAITDQELLTLFEAARWAPSSYNNQPWRFIYAKRDTPLWDNFFALLVEANQVWAKNAAVLVILASGKNFEHNGKPTRTHSFDAGAAWQNLALQASSQGLIAHGMEGFDYERAHKTANLPEDFTVECMIAIGKPGDKSTLPEKLQAGETPNQRKALSTIAYEGRLAR